MVEQIVQTVAKYAKQYNIDIHVCYGYKFMTYTFLFRHNGVAVKSIDLDGWDIFKLKNPSEKLYTLLKDEVDLIHYDLTKKGEDETMITMKVTCDHCKKDISNSRDPVYEVMIKPFAIAEVPIMNCVQMPTIKHHICADCLHELFPSDGTQK